MAARDTSARRGLVIVEIALALALLVGVAGLLINSFARLLRVPRLRPQGLMVMSLRVPGGK